jgi:hypothetical protein
MHVKRYGLRKVISTSAQGAMDNHQEDEDQDDYDSEDESPESLESTEKEAVLYLTKVASKTRWSKRKQAIFLWKSVDDLVVYARKHLLVEEIAKTPEGRTMRDRYNRVIKMPKLIEGMEIMEFELSLSDTRPFKVN